MKILFIKLLILLFVSVDISYAQIRVSGRIIDKKTKIELEGVKVILKSANVTGGGFFTGVYTEANGNFDVSTSFRYPLDLVATKIGCKRVVIPIERKKNVYRVIMECEDETMEKIITEKKIKTNNSPIANPDKLVFLPDEEISINEDSVLYNDSDPDGDDLQILIYKTLYGGLLQLNDGSYNYIPSKEYDYSSDTAYYILSDGYDSDSSYIVLNKLEVGTDLTEVIDINPIYFDLNSSEIREDAQIELDKVVKIMKDYPNMIIEIGSHTDCTGSEEYNLKLSDERAKASARFIQKRINATKDLTAIHYAIVKNFKTKMSYKSFYARMNNIKYRRQIFNYIGDRSEEVLGFKSFEEFENYLNSDEVMKTFDERIQGKGYGENKPKEICNSGCSSCSDKQHQLNRRTEFIIVDLGQKKI